MQTNLNIYFASMRHLKPVQIWSRLSLLARRKVLYRFDAYTARFNTSPEAHDAETQPVRLLPMVAKPPHSPQLEDIASGHFTFLNRRVSLGKPIDWFPTDVTQLWRYNLHYFDYAAAMGWAYAHEDDARAYPVFRDVVVDWMDACPPTTPIAWDPYPISLRVSNWIKAYAAFAPDLAGDEAFAVRLRNSIYNQVAFLEHNLEYHLLGNHLIENGRALFLAGLFFQGKTANRWYEKGQQILWRELGEQFLKDGAHYERSPMYHQIMLALYAEVVAMLQTQEQAAPEGLHDRVRAMRNWLAAMLHPDGEIALFNDAAFHIAGPPAAVLTGDEHVDSGFQIFADSGYYSFRDTEQGHLLLMDCGPLGPDYQPGHGHCDALSYELSVAGRRFVVDSGVESYYGDLDWRLYYRSTRAHNTVVVDGAEQSEIWSRFRVAQRAQPKDVLWDDQGSDLSYVIASHTGYNRLPGHVEHRRWICWVDRRFWLICDRITGDGSHDVESLIHFHPDVQIVTPPAVTGTNGSGLVRRDGVDLTVAPWGAAQIRHYCGERDPIQGWYAPEFGTKYANPVWGLRAEGNLPRWMGYILWPGAQDVAVGFEPNGVDACRVKIEVNNEQYTVVCRSSDIKVEKN